MKVLDHGSVEFIGSYGSDETIIESARMSTGKGFQGWDKDARLLEYLYSHFHLSPFEMVDFTVEVHAPIFVAREWMRHRTFSFNEFSARYAQMPNVHYVPESQRIGKQDAKNKQGSARAIDDDYLNALEFANNIRNEQSEIYESYENAIVKGVSRELARINTPVSRYTRFRAKANLRNWLQFLELRLAENAQYEIRVYAQAIAETVKEKWPRTWALFEKYTLNSVTLTRDEYNALKGAP